MGFETTTLRDLVGCSNHWATGHSVVSKGQVVGMTGIASRGYTAMYLAHMNSLTASRCHINPLTAEWALRALIHFTLSNARRFYSSKGNPLDGKGLRHHIWNSLTASRCHIKAYQDASNQPPKWVCYRNNNNNNTILCKFYEKRRLGKIRVPDGTWTHDPPWSSRML